jgi:Reverse transcriptase (RNA-dependent DNA polymerase)
VGSDARARLDLLSADTILLHQLPVSRRLKPQWAPSFAQALTHTLKGLRAAVTSGDVPTAAAWSKLWHLLPCILLAPDGSVRRQSRFTDFACGRLRQLIDGALAFANKRATNIQHPPGDAAIRAAAPTTARQSGGLARAARRLQEGADAACPRSQETLQRLQLKHPPGDDTNALQAAQEAGWQRVLAHQPSSAGLAQVFTADSVRAGIARCKVGAAPGLSGLSNAHLQQCLQRGGATTAAALLQQLAWLARTLYTAPVTLPPAFWLLHSAARLSAVGAKARPIACGDTLRRLFASMLCRDRRAVITALLEPSGQYGVAVAGRAERVAATAQMLHDAGAVLLTIDGANAFNSISRSAVLREVAETLPELYAYVVQLYGADAEPALMFGLEGEAVPARVGSRQGVQQGDPLGPLLFALALRPVLNGFRNRFPELALPTYLDDMILAALFNLPLPDVLQRAHSRRLQLATAGAGGDQHLCEHS